MAQLIHIDEEHQWAQAYFPVTPQILVFDQSSKNICSVWPDSVR